MARASASDRAYFDRVARQNASLKDDGVPASLAEMFDRLERIRSDLGALATPGRDAHDEGDLAAHLAFYERWRRIRSRGTDRA